LERNVVDAKGKIEVIYTCVDGQIEFNPILCRRGRVREKFDIPNSAPLIVFVGRLHPQKRPQLFVKIFAEILKEIPNAYALMVGDGALRKDTEAEIAKLGVKKHCQITGVWSDMAGVYRDADLLLMCSAYEGLAYVSFEAMAMELPQIFSDVDGQSELIGEEEGILVSNGSGEVNRFAQAAISLLNDQQRCAKMGKLAREKVIQRFPLENNTKAYAKLYADAPGNEKPNVDRLIATMLRRHSFLPRILPIQASLVFQQCAREGLLNVALYGGGQCAKRLLAQQELISIRFPKLSILYVFDENPLFASQNLSGIPVVYPASRFLDLIDAVIICSDSVEQTLYDKTLQWERPEISVFRPYKGLVPA
jgi:hypothetical protein